MGYGENDLGDGLSFSLALHHLKEGDRAARSGWKTHLVIQDGMIHIKSFDGPYVVWQPAQSDLLAEDWGYGMKFSRALKLLLKGNRLSRDNWVPEGRTISLSRSRSNIIIVDKRGCKNYWSPVQSDILADDWIVIDS